jgi:hypothetical protein
LIILAKKYNKIIVKKNKIGILILCLFCQFSLDKLNLENIQRSGKERFGTGRKRCFLMQIQKGAIVNEYGFFTVLAKVNDTLVFQV